jgi:hypothetical protein
VYVVARREKVGDLTGEGDVSELGPYCRDPGFIESDLESNSPKIVGIGNRLHRSIEIHRISEERIQNSVHGTLMRSGLRNIVRESRGVRSLERPIEVMDSETAPQDYTSHIV